MYCMICSKESHVDIPNDNLNELKKEIRRITSLDCSYLALNDDKKGFCLLCKEIVKKCGKLYYKIQKVRKDFALFSTAISQLIFQSQFTSDSKTNSESETQNIKEFHDWNTQRLQKFLVDNLDSKSLLSEGLALLNDKTKSPLIKGVICEKSEFNSTINDSNNKPSTENINRHSGNPERVCTDGNLSSDGKTSDRKFIGLKEKRKKVNRKCPICYQHFLQKRSLDLHLHKHHSKDPKLTDSMSQNNCQICSKTFDTSVLLMVHLSLHQAEYECEEIFCRKSFQTQKSLEEHKLVHESNPQIFDCDFCPELLCSLDRQKAHQKIHLRLPKSYICEHCGNSYPSNLVLSNHINRVHKQHHVGFNCPVCRKCFSKRSALKTHERTHTGQKPFECDQCEFTSSQASGLKLHQRKHSGVMPYQCNYCNHSGFSYVRALRKHLAENHGDLYLAEENFLCEVCWKKFGKESHLVKHSLIHSKYKCQICNYQFRMRSHLNEHLLRHANLNLFQCILCNTAAFMRRKELIDHIGKVHPQDDSIRGTLASSEIITLEFAMELVHR